MNACRLLLVWVGMSAAAWAQGGLSQYGGRYQDDAKAAPSVVYAENGKLYAESARLPRGELLPAGGDSFKDEYATYTFHRDAKGMVDGYAIAVDTPGVTVPLMHKVSGDTTRLNHFPDYVKSTVSIPMRDGVKLHAVIVRPASADMGAALPFLMQRTPYGVDDYNGRGVGLAKPELAQSGYIFVYEDIRGRYGSEGQFVMNRPVVVHTAKTDVDETTDTRDTVEWLLKNVPGNSGKVGVLGVSYPGFLAMMAGIDAAPAVKAISPQAPMTDVWMGDDFFHNGAFRETYGFDYVQQLEAQKTDVPQSAKTDQYDFFLHNVNFAGAAKSAGMSALPTASRFLNEPSYTKFWRDMAVEDRLTRVEVPTLEVGGYWDQEDMWGTQEEYKRLHAVDAKHEVFMVLGPWNHGGWGGAGKELGGSLGKVEFGEATGTEYRQQFEAPFFEYYLKGKPGYDLKGVASYRTGVNKWERYDVWPPVKGFKKATIFVGKDASLLYESLEANQKTIQVASPEIASYVADPADPVPYRNRPVQSTYGEGSKWRTWLVEDQRFVEGRKDLAEFKGPVLESDLTVTGDVKAVLRASTTGTDADWIVKLIDMAPDGAQTMIAEEIFRGRYRKSFEKPEAIEAGKIVDYAWSLHGADHTFLKGHRMMVEVQSSWFPLYDRNPQTYVANIMTAPAEAYKAATVKIYGGSRLEFLSPEAERATTAR